jgi:hypothetical protein
MGAAEIAEMRDHLGFLRRYKEALRLKLNATEDLLVNGQREPSDRGVCRHLLAKVDRTVIEHAIGREPYKSDAAARARMLAGAIRLTGDVGILLAYLETLADVRSHVEAAQAFGEVVARIDFESVAPGRLARLLQVLVATFTDHERVQVLFGLLANPAFRRAFDAAVGAFPADVLGTCVPLRAVHRRVLEGTDVDVLEDLVRGMELLLAAPDAVLRTYPEPVRAGLATLALGRGVPGALADRAVGALLPTLAGDAGTYARVATRRAAQLLGRHADDRARAVLEELVRRQPGARPADRWLAALRARRLGRVAVTGDPPRRGRLMPGFWLDGQRAVWLRTAAAPDAERLAQEARLHAEAGIPGLAPIVEHGVGLGIPYVAVVAPGQPLGVPPDGALDVGVALVLAAGAARTLRALALAGIVLPDAEPERFVVVTNAAALTLADLDGAQRADATAGDDAHRRLAATLARRLLPPPSRARLPAEINDAVGGALDEPPALAAFAALLERAALYAPRE